LPKRATLPLESELRQLDRRALDEVVFDVSGLTAGEREAVYEAVVGLVGARLEKARSV
jgi:ferredoxin-fold anticodon binding domain-containing protein